MEPSPFFITPRQLREKTRPEARAYQCSKVDIGTDLAGDIDRHAPSG